MTFKTLYSSQVSVNFFPFFFFLIIFLQFFGEWELQNVPFELIYTHVKHILVIIICQLYIWNYLSKKISV